jgi:hypothetical protein
VPDDDYPGVAVGLEAARRSQSSFESPVVALDPVVGELLNIFERLGQQLVEDRWVDGGPVGGDLDRASGADRRPLKEPPWRWDVTALGQHHVDDLAELVDCPIQKRHWPATFS